MRWLQCMLLLPALAACSQATSGRPDRPQTANIGLRYMQAGEDAGFAKAVEPRALRFPIDHGSHPDFRTEWWYFTGTLQAAGGDRYGFELTFFRVALAPAAAAPRPSAWGTGQIWMAHLAVTDATGHRFVARERMAREAIGLAGVTTAPLRVRVKGWTATLMQNDETETWELNAFDEGVRLKLRLATRAPPILNGDHGLDRKGPEPGNASYYYSEPRLAASGVLSLDDKEVAVRGEAWMDREWSTSALDADIAGWDWFGLRLSDGSSLMYYRLRRVDGTADAFSGGTWVDAAGRSTRLARADVELAPLKHWTSPVSGARYPVAWHLRVPGAGVDFDLEPYLNDQELNLSVRYWEGAVRGDGHGPDGHFTADGYLELAGY
jgi:predicted secreted hydrolase